MRVLPERIGAAKGQHNCLRQAFDHSQVPIIERKWLSREDLEHAQEIAFVENRRGQNRADAELIASFGIDAWIGT